MTSLDAPAWYVYAVLSQPCAAPIVEAAILPGTTLDLVAGPPGASGESLSALVSLVPRALFTAEDPASRAADPDWVAARAAAHHEIVALAAASGPCLPLGFGTLFASISGVRDWLADHEPGLRRAMAVVAGREEWAVTLTEDSAKHAAWVEAHDESLRALVWQAESAGPGAGFLLARRLVKAREAARVSHGASRAAALTDKFGAVATVRMEKPPVGANAAWSLLAPPNAGIGAMLDALAATLADTGLALRATGPWPPYAFARAAWENHDG